RRNKKTASNAAPARFMRRRSAMISRLWAEFRSTGGENYRRERGKSRPLFAKRDSNFKILFRANDGGRSSMVEPQIVVLVVAGSSPVGHPLFKSQIPTSRLQNSRLEDLGFATGDCEILCL